MQKGFSCPKGEGFLLHQTGLKEGTAERETPLYADSLDEDYLALALPTLGYTQSQ